MSDDGLPMSFGKTYHQHVDNNSNHNNNTNNSNRSLQHQWGHRGGRGGFRDRGRGRGSGNSHFHHHHNNNNNNNNRLAGYKRHFRESSDILSTGSSAPSAANYFSPAMLTNPWRAWLEPDTVADDDAATTVVAVDGVASHHQPVHEDLVEYLSESGQRRVILRVGGPFDVGAQHATLLNEADPRRLLVSVDPIAIHQQQAVAIEASLALRAGADLDSGAGLDRGRDDALKALLARVPRRWSAEVVLPAAADSATLTSVALPGSLFVDVALRDDRRSTLSSPIEPRSPADV